MQSSPLQRPEEVEKQEQEQDPIRSMQSFPLLSLPSECQYSMLVHGFRSGILSLEKLQQAADSVRNTVVKDGIMRRIFKQGWLCLH